ncbi:MAG: transporter [Verrucomicrobia bacterium]|nr:transporter [Verrucomicrobiota bacterium]
MHHLRFSHPRVAALLAALAAAAPGVPTHAAEKGAPNKSAYTLFNPTPPDQMRDLSTDRPDQTESAYTLDAGHVQLEMDVVSHTHDRDSEGGADVRSRTWVFAPVNLKLGLLNRVDLQLMLDPHVRVRVEDRVARTAGKASGFGDATTRLKVNMWGNDGGRTALALMPFVKWPLSASSLRNGRTEGGLIVPLAIELAEGWGMGLMTEVDFVRNGADTGYDREWVNSVTVARDLTEKAGCYVEFFTVTGSAPGFKWSGQLDIGFTYALHANVQLDAGCNFGVTKSAPNYQPFAGISYRY